ncbi:hypothetical protein BLGI_3000 [Brevibacillus laterosporus GI-9]|nr:hypothetical protein BLGI_3000 [Brevibacillus laterosporus GI-9]
MPISLLARTKETLFTVKETARRTFQNGNGLVWSLGIFIFI